MSESFKIKNVRETIFILTLLLVSGWWAWLIIFSDFNDDHLVIGLFLLFLLFLMGIAVKLGGRIQLTLSEGGITYQGLFKTLEIDWNAVVGVERRLSPDKSEKDCLKLSSSEVVPLSPFESYWNADAWRKGKIGEAIKRFAPDSVQVQIFDT